MLQSSNRAGRLSPMRLGGIAPEIGSGRKYFSRPVLGAFLTYENCFDGLRGFVGGVPFAIRRMASLMVCRRNTGGSDTASNDGNSELTQKLLHFLVKEEVLVCRHQLP